MFEFRHFYFFNTKSSEAHMLAVDVRLPEQGAVVVQSLLGMSPLSDREASIPVAISWGCVYSFLCSLFKCVAFTLSPTCVALCLMPGTPHNPPQSVLVTSTISPIFLTRGIHHATLSPSSSLLWTYLLSIPESQLTYLPFKTKFPFFSSTQIHYSSYPHTFLPLVLCPCSFLPGISKLVL